MQKIRSISVTAFYIVIVISCFSCKKYLAEKTNKKLVVPATLQDATAMMDTYDLLARYYPSMPIESDDDCFFTDNYLNTANLFVRGNYVWEKEIYNDQEWVYAYQVVLNSNIVLQTLDNIPVNAGNVAEWNRVKGSALLFRAYAFYHVAQSYAAPYFKTTAAQQLGIPLRLDPDINSVSVRSSLEQTYRQIISDLDASVTVLPVQTSIVSRPNKAAAFGLLARTYLAMGDYPNAKLNADSCLSYKSTLIDYNTLNSAAANPLSVFNSEVILPSSLYVILNPPDMKIDSLLMTSYSTNDLRKSIFFQLNAGQYNFKGSYNGDPTAFSGIAVDEIYLTRAECNARMGNKDAALADLNTLLIKRFKTNTFVPVTATDANDALIKILMERRKELVQRGTRWTDLRRLNADPAFAKTLTRIINGQTYILPPNDPRYTMYFPLRVIAQSGMQQNVR